MGQWQGGCDQDLLFVKGWMLFIHAFSFFGLGFPAPFNSTVRTCTYSTDLRFVTLVTQRFAIPPSFFFLFPFPPAVLLLLLLLLLLSSHIPSLSSLLYLGALLLPSRGGDGSGAEKVE
jgi:hypothetical protein